MDILFFRLKIYSQDNLPFSVYYQTLSKPINHMKKILLSTAILAALGVVRSQADFNPVPLTPGSFTADVIVEKNAPRSVSDYTTLTMDGGTNNNSWVWMEKGVDTKRPDVGLPAAGSTFAAVQDPNHTFRMPASYAGNCAVALTANGIPNATLTVSTPAPATAISLLNAGGGASTINFTIHYQGGGTQSGQLDIIDWHNLTPPNYAWVCNGRYNTDNGQTGETWTGKPRLFFTDIYLSDTVNPVVSIDFSTTSGSRVVIFGLSTSTDGTVYTPVTIGGFNRDVVVEVGVPVTGSLYNCNVIMDSGATNITANTWYEAGFNTGSPTTGLPAHGSSISGGSPTHTFTMPPTYVGNCVLYVGAYEGYTAGTLNLTTPAAYTRLSFLGAAGNGPVVANVTVHFADSSTETYSVSIADWFNGDAAFYTVGGRFNPQTLGFDSVGSANPRLRINDITLANTTSPVTSIDFSYASGGRAMIFAVAGQATDGGVFSPALITGFNADGVIEAGTLYTSPLTTATTASMDGGTNNTANTWYEQGYYSYIPNSGFPPAGSTITSLAQPDHHYIMPASYTANNCVFVDVAHTTANLTLATPATYSAISFLSAAANGGDNGVTNQAIMQYADGTSETNTFNSQDWFNKTPVAYYANGRINLNTRTLNSDPGRATAPSNPRLYEAQFALGNTTSPLTNVILTYLNPTNSTGRVYVFAVSATAGSVPPIIASVSVTPNLTAMYEGSNIVFNAVITGGTTPITYQWQKLVNGVYVNVNNDARIAGATTTTMTITGGVWTDSGTYHLVASNPVGSVNSGLVTLGSLLTTLPDVTAPGDAIAIFPGTTTPTAESVDHAIDNAIQKYLNWDGDAAAPFVGPVGFTVKPSIGNTIVSALRFYTANDSEGRDPADYVLEGSNDGSNFAPISSGALALPAGRNTVTTDALSPLTQNLQEVRFTNTKGYSYYRLSFNNVKNNAANTSMQIGEIEFLGVVNPNPPPAFTLSATDVTANEGTTATFTSLAVGPTPLTYQWYDVTGGDPGVALSGQTGPNLSLPNVTTAQNGASYRVVATNPYGSTTNPSPVLPAAQLTVNSGPVSIVQDLPTDTLSYEGRTVALSVGVTGTAPTYQWLSNGVALVNGGRISGATSSTLLIANVQPTDAAVYQLDSSNLYGGPVSSTPTTLHLTKAPTFQGDGLGWNFVNGGGGGSFFNGDDLLVTTTGTSQQRAAWLTIPMNIDGFKASFVYQDLGPNGDGAGGGADGFALVLQNSDQGVNAIGGGGGALAYGGITKSAALTFNIYDNNTPGIAIRTNGVTGTPYASTAPVNIAGGHPIQVNLDYDGATLKVVLSDLNTADTFTTNMVVGSLSEVVGTNVAYVGITAATGGIAAFQQFSNFQYVPRTSLTATPAGSNILLTWPASVGGYAAAVSSSLNGPWTPLTGINNQTNGLHHRVVTPAGNSQFYRLVMPLP